MREHDVPADSAELRVAKRVRHYLAHRKPLIHAGDDNLLLGNTTSKPIGAPVYPEFLGLMIWPELDTIGEREVNPQRLTPDEAETLNLDVFPYWIDETALELVRAQAGSPPPMCLRLLEKIAFYISGKVGCISHCVPYYERVLREGMRAIVVEAKQRELELAAAPPGPARDESLDFYRAVQIALQGMIEYATRLGVEARRRSEAERDPKRRAELLELAALCEQVPAGPARSFREALQSLWICQIGIHAENTNMAMSPGRLDQILWPWYRDDVVAGRLTPEQAVELCCCLWLKLADNTNLVPETAERLWGGAGSTPAVTFGGVDAQGRDAVNDLTYVLLRTTELMKLRDPSVNARYHYEVNDHRYRQRVVEVICSTGAIPAFHNDVTDIATLVNQGESLEHAREFAVVGCVELASRGRDYGASSSIMFNLARALELALYQGKSAIMGDEQLGPRTPDPTTLDDFEQFYAAFEVQLRWLIGQAVEINERLAAVHQAALPTPLLSALFEGPLEQGRDLIRGGAVYNSSGASHVAFPDVVDSLVAIEYAVFRERRCTMAELIAALRTNFRGHDELHAFLRNKAPKFGTEHELALAHSKRLVDLLYAIYQSHVNYRGGRYRPAYWTMTTHAGQGKLCGALPSGRAAHAVFSSGITPASQASPDIVTAFSAVAALDARSIPGGEALNIKYTPCRVDEDRGAYLERFGELVEGYFRKGGMQVQFNVQSYATLIDAAKHPENYPELIVRVSGYSAYFKDLSPPMQEELILRTQYDLGSGAAVPLPDDWKETLR
jgi:formate C-acetyltransferase